MYNMWHNWAAVLEVASDLIKQMIHLQLVKVLQLRKEVKHAFSWLPARWWTRRDRRGSNLPSTVGFLAATSPPRFVWGTFWQQQRALQPGSAQPDTAARWWMEMEKTRTSSGLGASHYQPTPAFDQVSHVSPHTSSASFMTQTHDPAFPIAHKHRSFTKSASANCTAASLGNSHEAWSSVLGAREDKKPRCWWQVLPLKHHVLLMADAEVSWLTESTC